MDFNFYNFYFRYKWLEGDFDNFQSLLKSYVDEARRGLLGASIMNGLDYASAATFDVTVNQGVAVNESGEVLSSAGGVVTALGPSGGLGRKSLVVVRLLETDINYIQEPTNPSNTVPLKTTHSAQLVVIDGTPDANPVYPSKVAGDVILFGLLIDGADTQITSASIDYSVSEFVGKNSDILKMTQGYDAIITSEKFGNHRTLEDFITASGSVTNKRILIKEDQLLDAELTINNHNLQIDFVPGITIESDGAASGLIVAASGVFINGGRFKDFANAVIMRGEYGTVFGSRFKDCTNEIVDETTYGFPAMGLHTEA